MNFYNDKYKKFKCPICLKGFPNKRRLKAHFQDVHKGRDFNKLFSEKEEK